MTARLGAAARGPARVRRRRLAPAAHAAGRPAAAPRGGRARTPTDPDAREQIDGAMRRARPPVGDHHRAARAQPVRRARRAGRAARPRPPRRERAAERWAAPPPRHAPPSWRATARRPGGARRAAPTSTGSSTCWWRTRSPTARTASRSCSPSAPGARSRCSTRARGSTRRGARTCSSASTAGAPGAGPPGTGLGLAIARELVAPLGRRRAHRAARRGGSRAVVTLPLAGP